MIKSRLGLWVTCFLAIMLAGYVAGCGEVSVGPHEDEASTESAQNKTAAQNAAAANTAEDAEEKHAAAKRPEDITQADLDQAIKNFTSGDPNAMDEALPMLSNAYASRDQKIKQGAGAVLAKAAMYGSSPDLRSSALAAMAADPYDALNVALQASRDKSPQVVATACQILGKTMGQVDAKNRLVELSKSSDEEVRRAASQVLMGWYVGGGKAGLAEFATMLGNPIGDQSSQAEMQLHRMGRVNPQSVLPFLISTLRTSPNPRTRAAAAITMACVCAGSSPAQKKFAAGVRAGWYYPVPVPPARLDGLRPMMDGLAHDSDPYVREACAQGLGYLGAAESAPVLAAALKDPDADVRRRAASALVAVPHKAVQPQLEKALATDPSPDVRREAAEALFWVGDKTVVPALMAAARDANAEVRRYALDSLGELGDLRATSTLIKLFQDPEENVRWAAVLAVGRLADPSAEDALLQAVRDPSPMVATAADQALRKLGVLSSRGLHLKSEGNGTDTAN